MQIVQQILFIALTAFAIWLFAKNIGIIRTGVVPKTKKAKGGSQVRLLKDSSESTAERSRRLLRECKGLPNAGACAGYTR